jgi:hypothetical protein
LSRRVHGRSYRLVAPQLALRLQVELGRLVVAGVRLGLLVGRALLPLSFNFPLHRFFPNDTSTRAVTDN